MHNFMFLVCLVHTNKYKLVKALSTRLLDYFQLSQGITRATVERHAMVGCSRCSRCVHTDGHSSIGSASVCEQEYMYIVQYFVLSATPSSVFYICSKFVYLF